ncbi:amidohydrolase [Priestia flexa]|uniref:amidohydrolase n=1 Tax=Priestia flexa TaxID=86664 RepID=UPI002492ECD5|nr:amidohydrolase [Priestia flexa]
MGTLFYGGKIYTMAQEGEWVESVFVENGMIEDLGFERDVRNAQQKNTQNEVNLDGSVMYPGFVDSHLHLIGHGEKLLRLDLSQASSASEVLKLVQEKVKQTPPGEWIIGEGWDENQWDDRELLHYRDLDSLTDQHPIVLKRVCRHGLLANGKALTIAKISKGTESPEGGAIQVDELGMPTGFLADQAQELVTKHIPVVSEAYLEKALQVSIKDCVQYGLTGVHTEDLNYYGGFTRTYQAFKKVIEDQRNLFRCNLLVHHGVVESMDEYVKQQSTHSAFLEFGAMKIFADGSLGSQSALLSFPYKSDPSTNGLAIQSLPELKQLVRKARELSRPVAIHAIGDLAFEYVLDSIEQYPPSEKVRDRIIHAQILRKDLIERTKRLPVVLDIQPRFLASDFPWVIDRIGEENLKYCYAWKTLLDNSIMCAGGSDAPIEPINPLLGIHAAVTRKVGVGDLPEYMPKEKLTMFQAIQLFTLGSAQATSQEHIKGKIKKGYIGDFTVFKKDLFEINVDELLEVQVHFTIINGEVVYQCS